MSMTHIETIELGSSASSITFSSIPQDYTDLMIKVLARSDRSIGNNSAVKLNFNSNNSNQSFIALRGDGSSDVSFSGSELRLANINSASTGGSSNTFSSVGVYISNYTASQPKSLSTDFAMENNATFAYQGIIAALWNDNSAVTSIELLDEANFVAGSTFSLYGITAGGSGTVGTA